MTLPPTDTVFALIDGNCFYVSFRRLFNPKLSRVALKGLDHIYWTGICVFIRLR
jgi:hypothetical protein